MIDKINKLLNTEMTKKEFLKKAGIGIFLLIVSPTLIGWIFKDNSSDLFIKDNQIFYKNQMIMEVQE